MKKRIIALIMAGLLGVTPAASALAEESALAAAADYLEENGDLAEESVLAAAADYLEENGDSAEESVLTAAADYLEENGDSAEETVLAGAEDSAEKTDLDENDDDLAADDGALDTSGVELAADDGALDTSGVELAADDGALNESGAELAADGGVLDASGADDGALDETAWEEGASGEAGAAAGDSSDAADGDGLILESEVMEDGFLLASEDGYADIIPVTETLEEGGLASTSGLSLFRLFSDTEYTDSYGSQLSGDAKGVYDQMVAMYVTERDMSDFTYTLTSNPTYEMNITEEDKESGAYKNTDKYKNCVAQVKYPMQAAYDAFVLDHPETSWMSTPSIAFSWGLLKTDEGTYNIRVYNSDITVNANERYTGAYTDRDTFDENVAAACEAVQSELGEDADTADVVLAIHDYICGNLTYDYSYASYGSGTDQYAWIHSAAGVFVKNVAVVCDGYAKSFKILCDQFGIECTVIPGEVSSGAHAWNYVKMEDGEWYLVDTTWDDSSSGTIKYTYFLLGSQTVPAGYSSTIAELRTVYTNFSQATYTASFTAPILHTSAYHTEHIWGTYISDENATCTEVGTKTAVCEIDGCDVTDTIPEEALGHSFTQYVSDGNATCTEDGTQTAKCDRCDETDTIPEEALGHSFTEYISDENATATCTEDGTKTAKCDRCDETDTITEKALGHSFTQYVSDENATCTEDGTQTAKCDRCDETDTITEKALGHSFTQYVSDENATCTEDGTQTAKCDRCNETNTVTETGSATGHLHTEVRNSRAATCALAGYTGDTYCADCGTLLAAGWATAVLAHTWDEGATTVSPTAVSEGTRTYTCTVCQAVKTETVDRLAATITLDTENVVLQVKQSFQMTVSGLAEGDSVVSWTSGNSSVVKVNKQGKITGKKKGTAVVTVTLASGLTRRIKVKVQAAAVKTTGISGVSRKLTLKAGQKVSLAPIVLPVTSQEKLSFVSSNKKVAKVTAKGKITAKKKGTAVITVRSGSVSVKCKITVK